MEAFEKGRNWQNQVEDTRSKGHEKGETRQFISHSEIQIFVPPSPYPSST